MATEEELLPTSGRRDVKELLDAYLCPHDGSLCELQPAAWRTRLAPPTSGASPGGFFLGSFPTISPARLGLLHKTAQVDHGTTLKGSYPYSIKGLSIQGVIHPPFLFPLGLKIIYPRLVSLKTCGVFL